MVQIKKYSYFSKCPHFPINYFKVHSGDLHNLQRIITLTEVQARVNVRDFVENAQSFQKFEIMK